MKFLTDRKEIAEAINIKRYPTFIFDVTNSYEDYEGYYKTPAVMNVAYESKNYGTMYHAGELYIEIPRDRVNKGVTIDDMVNSVKIGNAQACCLTNSFGASDVLEMANNRQLQVIHPDDIVIVVFKKGDTVYVEEMKVSSRLDIFCTTMGSLQPVE